MCWSLSPVFVKKKRGMGYREKNIWTHEGPSIEKKRKKCGHMKVHEKKERKKKISMLSKEFI